MSKLSSRLIMANESRASGPEIAINQPVHGTNRHSTAASDLLLASSHPLTSHPESAQYWPRPSTATVAGSTARRTLFAARTASPGDQREPIRRLEWPPSPLESLAAPLIPGVARIPGSRGRFPGSRGRFPPPPNEDRPRASAVISRTRGPDKPQL